MSKLEKNWICENCGDLLGFVVDDNTVCQCSDQVYGIAWCRMEEAQKQMDTQSEKDPFCSERLFCLYFLNKGCYKKCATFIDYYKNNKKEKK